MTIHYKTTDGQAVSCGYQGHLAVNLQRVIPAGCWPENIAGAIFNSSAGPKGEIQDVFHNPALIHMDSRYDHAGMTIISPYCLLTYWH